MRSAGRLPASITDEIRPIEPEIKLNFFRQYFVIGTDTFGGFPMTRIELPHVTWHHRGYLPHYDERSLPQSITFRLHDSVPEQVIHEWQRELAAEESGRAKAVLRTRIEKYIDKGLGAAWLARPTIATMVQQNLLFHETLKKYTLQAWVIMPNHVHVLMTPDKNTTVSTILHSWKGYTAREANRILGRTGRFWQPDYFDRFVRDDEHFFKLIQYIQNNPVKAGLCSSPEECPHSSAFFGGADAKHDWLLSTVRA
jgi:putative DNA methylase